MIKHRVIFASTETCNKCHQLEPHLLKLMQNEFQDVEYQKVTDINVLEQLNVTTVPAILLFRCESEWWRIEDIVPVVEMKKVIEDFLADNWE
jgi:hypothetical protein